MKKIGNILLCLVLICSFAMPTVFAEREIKVFAREKEILFDVPPRMMQDRVMVPIRAMFEALGALISWDEANEVATAVKDSTMVTVRVGSDTLYVNGQPRVMDAPAVEIDGRILVSARYAAEALGCSVYWDEADMAVYIHEPAVAQPAADVLLTEKSAPVRETNSLTGVYREDASQPKRVVEITCTKVIRGEQANVTVALEQTYQQRPTADTEWVILEFQVGFLSSDGGKGDRLSAGDIIRAQNFRTANRDYLKFYDTATLRKHYPDCETYGVNLYPGESHKVVIGLLVKKSVGDILLKLSDRVENTDAWLNCMADSESTEHLPTATGVKRNGLDFLKRYVEEYGEYSTSAEETTLTVSENFDETAAQLTTVYLQYRDEDGKLYLIGVREDTAEKAIVTICLGEDSGSFELTPKQYRKDAVSVTAKLTVAPAKVRNTAAYQPTVNTAKPASKRTDAAKQAGQILRSMLASMNMDLLYPNGYTLQDLGFALWK